MQPLSGPALPSLEWSSPSEVVLIRGFSPKAAHRGSVVVRMLCERLGSEARFVWDLGGRLVIAIELVVEAARGKEPVRLLVVRTVR